MKYIFIIGIILFSGPHKILADEIILPTEIMTPNELLEGVERTFTTDQVKELQVWAENAKTYLQDLLLQIKRDTSEGKIERILKGINYVAIEKRPLHSELLMRYVLNRALIIDQTILKYQEKTNTNLSDLRAAVLTSSLNKAIHYYQVDVDYFNGKNILSFADFGKEYFHYTQKISVSLFFNAQLQYELKRMFFDWLKWDLWRDTAKAQFSDKIIKIDRELQKQIPLPLNDVDALTSFKSLMRLEDNLGL